MLQSATEDNFPTARRPARALDRHTDSGDSSQALLAFPGGAVDVSAFVSRHPGDRTPTTITTSTGIVLEDPRS